MRRNFDNWETQDLEITFGLKRILRLELLQEWLKSESEFNDYEKSAIENLAKKLELHADYWNEDELKMQGIATILNLVNYQTEEFNIFSQRPLTATIGEVTLTGRVDFMLAKGWQKPLAPYFFIHEYKQERKGGETDPKGQLLAELVAAQHLNDYKFPSYGCYVLGRMWFFVVLDKKEYSISNALNSSDEDIYKIIAMLRKIKDYIVEWKKL
jgi:hypothetical protein